MKEREELKVTYGDKLGMLFYMSSVKIIQNVPQSQLCPVWVARNSSGKEG